MKRLFVTSENQMKKWLAIVGFCVFLTPCAYGETINYDNGDKYVGDVSNGVRHGQGTYTFASGEKYVGEWKDGKRHGQGTKTFADGRIEEGIWKDHRFQYAQKVTPPVIARKTPPPSPTVTAEKPKPKVDRQQRLELARRTQEALQVLGLYSGKLDGIMGVRTRSAIQRWQRRNGYSATGEITEIQLTRLEQEAVTRLAEKDAEPKLLAVSSLEACPTPAERGGRWHPPTADVRQPLTERTLANFHTRPRSTSCIHKQAGENSSNLELAIARGEL